MLSLCWLSIIVALMAGGIAGVLAMAVVKIAKD
jgi:hypothetical protein